MQRVSFYAHETYPTHVGGVHMLHSPHEVVEYLMYGKRTESRRNASDARIPDKVISRTR